MGGAATPKHVREVGGPYCGAVGGSAKAAGRAAASVAVVLLAACSAQDGAEPARTARGSLEQRPVRVLLAGDVMLGRGMAALVARDPETVLSGVRHLVAGADVAAANLESPLTRRPHTSPNVNALEADPAAAGAVALGGFDVLSIANNHAGDAGPESVVDTLEAVEEAGMSVVGGGRDLDRARSAVLVESGGLRIAFLAFDATRGGTAAGPDSPGVMHWDEQRARDAVAEARGDADLVIVGLHGGIEYLADTDPGQLRLAERLASWGGDIVWGHGPHVLQPVSVIDRVGGGSTVVATSLGNLLFDQRRTGTTRGGVLEILADRGGAFAYRLGITRNDQGRVHLDHWDLPGGDAALLDDGWWVPLREPDGERAPSREPDPAVPDLAAWEGFDGDVVDARVGDVTGDGLRDVVVSFRRTFRPTLITEQIPDRAWADEHGRAAHLGVYDPRGRPEWVAGTMFRPVAWVAVCDGALALAFDQLHDPRIVATGAWQWDAFGFSAAVELPGPGEPGCADIDGDGLLDPYIERESA